MEAARTCTRHPAAVLWRVMTPCAVWCPRSVITRKLKEMYQMITLGGDAELELVDSLDPFSEGIVFRCVGVEVVAEVVLLLWLLAGWWWWL